MTNEKIKKLIIPNLPYLFIFILFCNVGEAYRVSDGRNILFRSPVAGKVDFSALHQLTCFSFDEFGNDHFALKEIEYEQLNPVNLLKVGKDPIAVFLDPRHHLVELLSEFAGGANPCLNITRLVFVAPA